MWLLDRSGKHGNAFDSVGISPGKMADSLPAEDFSVGLHFNSGRIADCKSQH